MTTTEPPALPPDAGQPEPLVMPADGHWTPEEIAEFGERLKAAMANPGPLRMLPHDPVTDAERIEAAAAVLNRRYPGTRPDTLDFVISELMSLARAWRRIAAEAAPPVAAALEATQALPGMESLAPVPAGTGEAILEPSAANWRERAERAEAELEHAKAAAAGSHEGIRLWMLDCGELVAKHRARAEAAEARLDAVYEYCQTYQGDEGMTLACEDILAITGSEEARDGG